MSKYSTTDNVRPLPVRSPDVFPVHRGKGIIVTGAAGGIGRAIAELLLAEGATVIVADLREDAVAATVKSLGGKSHGVAMDVGSQESIAAGIAASEAALGRIDGLVNCAAIVRHADPLEISWDDWRRQFEINLFGAYEAARLVAKHMIATGTRGAIVSIASEAGKKGHKESLAYSASKAGIISMTRILSEALAAHDINVTSEPPEAIFDKMTSQQLVRHLQPIEVARVVSFLLGDAAMLVRGQAVNADAGETPY